MFIQRSSWIGIMRWTCISVCGGQRGCDQVFDTCGDLFLVPMRGNDVGLWVMVGVGID